MLGDTKVSRIAERRSATKADILSAAWAVAGEHGLANLTLRDVAQRMGMRPPSLYSYFASKNEIYDAMFAQAWGEMREMTRDRGPELPDSPREGITLLARTFIDFSVADLPRYQLMNQRILPGFAPSPEAYQPSIDVLEFARETLARYGVTSPHHVDMFTAVVGGLIESQWANDPGGTRWTGLLDEAMDMFADHVGLPPTSRTARSTS